MTILGDNYDYLIKMVVIGDSGVGKTNLLSRFEKNEFNIDSKATIGVEFATKTITIDNKKIKTQIWDTAGQERYRAITQAYYKGATGALVVFDLTRRSTYDNVTKWLKQLKQNSKDEIMIILVGNKSDLEQDRQIKFSQVVDYAHQNKLFYLQTSALNGINVQNAFMTVIKQIFQKIRKQIPTKPSVIKKQKLTLDNKLRVEPIKKKSKFC